jgi:hypothetical protein
MITLTEGNYLFELQLTNDETIDALGGNDQVTVIGTTIADTSEELTKYSIAMPGGIGDDQVVINEYMHVPSLDGGAGNGRIFVSSYSEDGYPLYHGGVAYGGEGKDQIVGGTLDAIYGGAGDHYIDGAGTDSSAPSGSSNYGGEGDDIIYGGGEGGTGSDMLFEQWSAEGVAGDDYIDGGEDINGGEGSDYLSGGYARGGLGDDIMASNFADGGSGLDIWFGIYLDLSWKDGGDKIVLDGQRLVSAFTGRIGEFILTPEGIAEIDEDGDGVADYTFEPFMKAFSPEDFLRLALHRDPTKRYRHRHPGG